MTKMQSVQILTDMAKRVIPAPHKTLHLEAWMKARGITREDILDALDTTEATVSRWINNRRMPRKADLRALEELLRIEPGALFRSPDDASEGELLAGLDQNQRDEALRFIAFLRGQAK